MTADDVVARAKAALEGVPEGPWAIERDESTHLAYDLPMYDAKKSPLAVCPDCGVRGGFEVPAAEFIAAARSLVPELVAELEALRASVNQRLASAWQAGFNEAALR